LPSSLTRRGGFDRRTGDARTWGTWWPRAEAAKRARKNKAMTTWIVETIKAACQRGDFGFIGATAHGRCTWLAIRGRDLAPGNLRKAVSYL